jgi:hypothetical protein
MPRQPSRKEFDELSERFEALRKGVERVLDFAASTQAEVRVLALICGHAVARCCSLASDPEEAFRYIIEGTEDAVTTGMNLDPASGDLDSISQFMKMIRTAASYELSVLKRDPGSRR